jgi:hypothetical protein
MYEHKLLSIHSCEYAKKQQCIMPSDGQNHPPLAGNMYNVHKSNFCAIFDKNAPFLNTNTKPNHNLIIGIKNDTPLLISFTEFSLHPIFVLLSHPLKIHVK